MPLANRPKPNATPLGAAIGVVACWLLAMVMWAALAVWPFGLTMESPAVWGAGGIWAMITLTLLVTRLLPSRVVRFDEHNQ